MKLGLEGQSVTHETVDYRVPLSTDAGFEISIEAGFYLRTPEGDFDLSSGSLNKHADPLQALLHQTGTASIAEESGALSIAFADRSQLHVEPDDSYEAWTVCGPSGMKIVSLPGGELARWSPEND